MSYRKSKNLSKKHNNKETKEEPKEIIIQKTINNIEEINYENYEEPNLEEVTKAFEYFDIDKSGTINISDLTKALSTFGDIMTEDEINKIFKKAGNDINTEEKINYKKFIEFWISNS